MKLIVNPHKIEIDKSPVNEREIDITKCEFEFADEITNDYVKEAYFTFNGTSYKEIIVNNQCAIPNEVLAKKGQVEIGVVAFLVENEEEIKRYNPSPAYFNTWLGSLKDNAENSEPITPSEMEQFEQALNDGLNEVANVDIDAEQLDNGMSVTITNRYGEDKTVYAYDGEKGETGATPNIQIGTVVTGDHSEVTRTGTNENPIFNFVLEKGDKGDTGNGIASVTKTSTSGLVDTYTITYTNGTTTTFNVTNGKGITNIAKTSTSGLEDTYTITYNDNTTSTFTVTNGNGISSIEKTGTQDNVDTYTIYYTNGTTSTFTVTNSTVTNQEFEELKAEHEELVNTLPRVEGTGESITLDNTAQYNMNVALSGNTSQVQYTGKNLWGGFTPYTYEGTAGITFTTNADGSITAVGTSTSSTQSASVANALSNGIYVTLPAGTYTVSCAEGTANQQIQIYDENSTSYGQTGATPYKTFTITETLKIILRLRVQSGETTNKTYYIQLEQGDTATSYETFVGGIPSPNPLYPQPIKKVTGNNTITVCGKNLYSGSNTLTSKFTYLIPSKIGESYTLSFNGSTTSTGGSSRVFFRNYTDVEHSDSATNEQYVSLSSTTSSYNMTITSTINGYLFIALAGSVSTFTFQNIMLEISPSVSTYEPYQSQTYPINLGTLEYCKIGIYSDEFYLDNGNWYKRGIIRKYTNGISSTITSGGTGRITLKSSSDLHDMTSSTNVYVNGLSKNVIISNQSEYSKPRYNTGWGGLTMVYPSNVIEQIGVTTGEELLNWFNNNEELYLVINESYDYPDITPITDTTLINQLNNLYNQIKSYKGQTNITQTNDELPFNIDASALYDLNNLISRVATLEVEV